MQSVSFFGGGSRGGNPNPGSLKVSAITRRAVRYRAKVTLDNYPPLTRNFKVSGLGQDATKTARKGDWAQEPPLPTDR